MSFIKNPFNPYWKRDRCIVPSIKHRPPPPPPPPPPIRQPSGPSNSVRELENINAEIAAQYIKKIRVGGKKQLLFSLKSEQVVERRIAEELLELSKDFVHGKF